MRRTIAGTNDESDGVVTVQLSFTNTDGACIIVSSYRHATDLTESRGR